MGIWLPEEMAAKLAYNRLMPEHRPITTRGAAMSVPTKTDELLELIRKSGMIDESQLTSYLDEQTRRATPLSTDAKTAAEQMVQDGLLTDFQREQFLLGKWRGFTLGKYKLLERVGIGGMGQVFLCEHLHLKRRVAIKVLPPAKAEQPSALGRFYREARAAGSIEHPNIVRTFDIDQDGNLHYIVMEYVDGTNLLDIVKQFGRLDIARATDYIRQVATGLEYAFRNGIIHRDVKPGNILITRDGYAKILDMGLARFYRDTTDLLTVQYDDKIVLGTADYVAPEQVANSHMVDTRADVYALGATFYYLLAGQPPFPSGTVSQKLLWHRTKDPQPIRELRPEVPEGLAAILARMMKKDPNQRYQTPGEVAAELAAWVPEHVPLPAAEEMPRLSPAAQQRMDTAEEVALTLESSPSGSVVGNSNPVASTSEQLPAVAIPISAPPPASSAMRSSDTRRMPFGPAPFAPIPQVDIPTANATAMDPTPANVRVPSQLPDPVLPPESPRNPLLIPLIVALTLAVVAIVGLILWILLSPDNPGTVPVKPV